MGARPILRFPDPAESERRKNLPSMPPQPHGPDRVAQTRRFQATFNRLAAGLAKSEPSPVLRQDPAGIAPERALVFVIAGNIPKFTRIASEAGLEVFIETDIEDIEDYPDGFVPAGSSGTLSRTLYATMPTLDALNQILSLWGAYKKEEKPPHGAAPWWKLFGLMLELRPWGAADRLSEDSRAVIESQLPSDDNAEMLIELEMWPTTSANKRTNWRREVEEKIVKANGKVLDYSSISDGDFIYEAVLAGLPSGEVRAMLANPEHPDCIAVLDGVQFVLPQMVGQATFGCSNAETGEYETKTRFNPEAPIRCALLDGTPTAAHTALEGGLIIEDVHDLVRLSTVAQRNHATTMASLILRGDLDADGEALQDARIVSVPLLVDGEKGAQSPGNRLFIDLLHTALVKLMGVEEPLAKDVFVINFSIGVAYMRFAGRISSLARLIDWWAAKEGVLFVISAGNVNENLVLSGIGALQFESEAEDKQRAMINAALRTDSFNRTLLAPAECLNGITVGALSKDLNGSDPPAQDGVIALGNGSGSFPQITSALGLGPFRSIKPDLLEAGGRQEFRALTSGEGTTLYPMLNSQRTGLITAAPPGGNAIRKSNGTSLAAALTTRAILQSAEFLIGENGPYQGQELPRRNLALLTRALAVNSARWSTEEINYYMEEKERLGGSKHVRAKEEVCRRYGHGSLVPELMQSAPEMGVTLVGLGSVRKDKAQIFRMPLPMSLSGGRVPRTMRVTLAWFSPVNATRAQYRLARLEAVTADQDDANLDSGWSLDLESSGPDANMVKRGSIWSRRLKNRTQKVPDFEREDIPIRVQCQETADGALNPDEDISYAIAVTLEVETDILFDVYQEIEQKIRLRLEPGT